MSPFESAVVPIPECRIDKLIFARLERLGLQPANLCSDSCFLRRAFFDVIGTLPTAQEVKAFLADSSAEKRAVLIDRLLARDEFADYWAMKWSDLLRIKAEFPVNLWPNAAQAYHRWIRTAVKENEPYDRFVRELLTESGSNFRVPQVNFYRAIQGREPEAIAKAVALTFMGTRAENWPKERLAGMATLFSLITYKATAEWKEEIVIFDSGKVKDFSALKAALPDGTPVRLSPDIDPRETFAKWLIDAKNPYFAKNIVNRIWSWLLGRGIVHEPDDIRENNPPVNPELLAYLESELVDAKFDLKHIFKLILNSQTYQLAPAPKSKSPEAEANFAYYAIRRLDAEVLIDALCQITGSTEKYTSPIPEPFTFIPENLRSIALPDGSITSSFLEMFGRPARDTGLESERNNRPTAEQCLHLLNSTHIQRKLERNTQFQALVQSAARPRDIVEGVYLAILSRTPTEDELKILGAYSQTGKAKGREFMLDLCWALINGAEFQYRH
ncbi:MAG TPA: DUF1553 domain-containing protein [Planctomycetota bacterium]|nr:DUF1553 domain-containing protein [Planctomycetota bacterium]